MTSSDPTTLIDDWLTLPDIAELWGVSIIEVRRCFDDGEFIAVKTGTPKVLRVPTAMVDPIIPEKLPGTLTVLRDAGYSETEILVWLFTADDSLPGTPMQHLRDGRRGEIRRRAQAMAF